LEVQKAHIEIVEREVVVCSCWVVRMFMARKYMINYMFIKFTHILITK